MIAWRFFKPEDAGVPLRFLLLVAHGVIILSVAIDETIGDDDNPKISETMSGGGSPAILKGFSYAGVICSLLEVVTLFMGATMFMRPMLLLSMLAHAAGLILVSMFIYQHWPLDDFIGFIVAFSGLPVIVELMVLLYKSTFAYARY